MRVHKHAQAALCTRWSYTDAQLEGFGQVSKQHIMSLSSKR